MNTRKIILVSSLSCLVTVAAMFIILISVYRVGAQSHERQPVGSLPLAAATQTATPEALTQPIQDPNLGNNGFSVKDRSIPEGHEGITNADSSTVFQNIAGVHFKPVYSETMYTYGSAGCTYITSGSSALDFPLILPPGSTIHSIRLYFNDTSISDSTLVLQSYDGGSSGGPLATIFSSGTAGLGYSTVSGLNIVPDYSSNNYNLVWVSGDLSVAMQLCGVQVGYTPPSIFGVGLPDVQK